MPKKLANAQFVPWTELNDIVHDFVTRLLTKNLAYDAEKQTFKVMSYTMTSFSSDEDKDIIRPCVDFIGIAMMDSDIICAIGDYALDRLGVDESECRTKDAILQQSEETERGNRCFSYGLDVMNDEGNIGKEYEYAMFAVYDKSAVALIEAAVREAVNCRAMKVIGYAEDGVILYAGDVAQ